MRNWRRLSGVTALLALLALGGCDFVKQTTVNPNAVPDATVDQLFTSIQVNTFFFTENNVARMAAIWLQQMAGTDRQFSALDTYVQNETSANGEFSSVYTGGGLIDMHKAEALAEAANRNVYDGVLKIYEAYMVGMAASYWGDIPYSQAANPKYPTPKLDKQEDVYAAVQNLLDQAITELQSGQGVGPGSADMVFNGDASKWLAVAHTLKARFYMHWVEAQQQGMSQAQTACGGDCLQEALAETQNGIQSPAGNWVTIHTSAQTETNVWYQFMNDRSGYISAGAYLVNLLKSTNDPRLSLYFSQTAQDTYVGSAPGQNLAGASALSMSGAGSPTYSEPMVSCSENAFIAAEANYDLGNTAAARQAYQAGVACQNQRWGVTVSAPDVSGMSGQPLLTAIMTQKYIAEFLNPDAWNDYKRTCLPVLQSYEGKPIPGRVYYGLTERQTNPNIPAPAQQPARNTNDPVSCQ